MQDSIALRRVEGDVQGDAQAAGEPGCEQRAGAPREAAQGRRKHSNWKHARELFWHYWLPVLVMLTLIKLESTDAMSGEHTGRILERMLLWLGHPMAGMPLELLNMAIRKCGHMLGYGLLCASWLLLLRGSYWLQHEYQLCIKGGIQILRLWWRPVWGVLAVLCTLAVAAADEFHQMSIPSRTGCWQDMLLDTAAATVAAFLFWTRARWRCRPE